MNMMNGSVTRQMLGNLTTQERSYLRYLRVKERGRERWARKRYNKMR
ncbi:MAG: hypothetical protein ABIH63_04075 [archaeon]